MKIVQSQWSRPSDKHGGYLRYHGRWPHPRYFWYSWVVSTQWALEHYGQVELVTDNDGARWMVDTLKLPFTTVRTDLEKLDVSGELWAYGKIAAYALQETPFFHIDGDVYLAGKLPEPYEQADLVCQLFEVGGEYPGFERIYDANVKAIEQQVPELPGFWSYMKERVAANCGIFGGRNIAAIQRYCRDVMDWVTSPKNAAGWRTIWLHAISCVVEQQALWCSARQQGLTITPLFEKGDFEEPELFKAKALHLNFNHAAVEGKNPIFGDHLAKVVEEKYPKQFQILADIFPRRYTELSLPTMVQYDMGEEGKIEAKLGQVEIVRLRETRKPQ